MGRKVFRSWGVILALAIAGCGHFETGYFQGKVNEATQEMVARRYGPPHSAETLSDGRTVWTYFDRGSGTASYSGTVRKTMCRAYKLTFDDHNILRDWNQLECRN
ncbi:MAG: hypothetical protein ACT4OO_08065 [Nitrospiraceae bacterium]